MSSKSRGSTRRLPAHPALRICLDVNVWVAFLIGHQNDRVDTVPMRLVGMVQAGRFEDVPLQLVVSQEMMGTLEAVLRRLGLPSHLVEGFPALVGDLMRTGPQGLEPAVLTAGRDQLAMHDREDAGVLAACMADRVDLLVTDNLADFVTRDAERRETRRIVRRDGSVRHLCVLLHRREDGVSLAVAHPIDAVDWLAGGFRPTLEGLRRRYP